MPKPLDPSGLEGAFAKGPPSALDFLIPPRPGDAASRAPQTIAAQPVPKKPESKAPALPKEKTKKTRKKKAKKKATPRPKKKTRTQTKKKATPRPRQKRAAPTQPTPPAYQRPVWTVGAPPLCPGLRDRLRARIDRLTGRLLNLIW